MTNVRHLFGTDGVRGIAGQPPLDPATIQKLGPALAVVLEREVSERPLRVLLGEDTRESSPWISRTLAAGLGSRGVNVVYAGVITTPGVAFLTRRHGFAAGVMVSASHNPYQDNGIKVLSGAGTKLPESLEIEIERVLSEMEIGPEEDIETPLVPAPELRRDYVRSLADLVP